MRHADISSIIGHTARRKRSHFCESHFCDFIAAFEHEFYVWSD